jgi:putative transcriptional regulator
MKKMTISDRIKSSDGKIRHNIRLMTPQEIERAARSDPDAQPLTPQDMKRMKRIPRSKIIRMALRLTQVEFAARYHIPLGTLRDWEQGRVEPDRTARAYLTVIARDPKGVHRALETKPH